MKLNSDLPVKACMRTLIALAVLAASFSAAWASGSKQIDSRVPVKLPIRHADPWAVKAMIEGTQITQPELSTIWGILGGNAGPAAGNNQRGTSPLLGDGYLVVNPTDNSLWWYPKRG